MDPEWGTLTGVSYVLKSTVKVFLRLHSHLQFSASERHQYAGLECTVDVEFLRPEPAVLERLVGASSDKARPMGFVVHKLGVTSLLRLLKDQNHDSWFELENAFHESNPSHALILACPEQEMRVFARHGYRGHSLLDVLVRWWP